MCDHPVWRQQRVRLVVESSINRLKMARVSSNLAEQVIEKGLATVVRHKRDDEDRSLDFDKLMAAEQAYGAFTRYLGILRLTYSPGPSTTGGVCTQERKNPPQNSSMRPRFVGDRFETNFNQPIYRPTLVRHNISLVLNGKNECLLSLIMLLPVRDSSA
jgi:hypothetical protein